MHIRIGTRTSDLARIQAEAVGRALLKAIPGATVEYVLKKAEGDLDLKTPLFKLPDKGVFTRDLTELLISGAIDIAVHSWKDLPLLEGGPTAVVATLPRADLRDAVIFRKDRVAALAGKRMLKVLSSSPRRAHNLSTFLDYALPCKLDKIEFVPVRGNVQTRMRKLFEEDADALVVAKAALDRLMLVEDASFAAVRELVTRLLKDCRWMITPLTENPCAPGQGALAIEARRDREDLLQKLTLIDSPAERACVEIERRTLQGYGGGCHQKIGMAVIDRSWGRISCLRGVTDQGEVLDSKVFEGKGPRPPRAKAGAMWPEAKRAPMFHEACPLPAPVLPAGPAALWVAKSNALPDGIQLGEGVVCWAAGLETWRKLAARGVWVNGCAEGMGELEKPDLKAFCGNSLSWFKVSHRQAPSSAEMKNIATYELKEREDVPDLRGKTHFFWRSGSELEAALRHFPEIKSGWHCSGPGNTHRRVCELIDDPSHISISLDFETWQQEVMLNHGRDDCRETAASFAGRG